ncbi:HIT family protein [Halostella litorea]|uniref:HIT family protein n=1 Tax=Halostella litorea TaxID=2528831 RepID=UPI0010924291|nr:HIT domain-containing protein [Halostella litorea]
MNGDCEFCRVVHGESDVDLLYGDDRTAAFLDRNPAVRGHTLVVPKRHREELLVGDGSVGVWRTVQRVARALETVLDPEGFSTFHTSGPLVGNVEHAHVHLLPREADDTVHIALDRTPLGADAADRLTSQVRAEL